MHKLKLNLVTIYILMFLAITGCATITANSKKTDDLEVNGRTVLTISGSGGTTPILAAIAADFEADVPGYRINTLTGSGTGGGVKGIIKGALDVAAMGRPPTEEETSKISYIPLGSGPEIPFTHIDVNIESLSSEQISTIFSGEVTNWSQVGGPDLPIVVYVRGETTPHTKILRQFVLNDMPFRDSAQVMGGMGDIISAVEGTLGGIGFANWPTVLAKGANVHPIAVDGIRPGNASYPARLEIGIAYLPKNQAKIQPLVDWLLSEAGQVALQEFSVIIDQ